MLALIWQILTKKSLSEVDEAAQCGGSSAYTMLILAGMDGSRKHTDLYSAWRTSEEGKGLSQGRVNSPDLSIVKLRTGGD